MIRFFLVCFILVAYLIVTIPLAIILYIVRLFAPKVTDAISRFLVRMMFHIFIFITGSKVEVRGMELLPKDEAVLFVGNHRSYFDILVTYAYLDRPLGFVAKDSMKKAYLLRDWMNFIHCLFLNRTDLKEGMKTILAGAEQIKNGISVFIFPEGTRGKTEGAMNEFKEGSLKMAQKAKCKIIPVALTNTGKIWEDQFPKMKPAHVIMEVGEPIDIETLEKEDKKYLGLYTQKKIQAILDKNTTTI